MGAIRMEKEEIRCITVCAWCGFVMKKPDNPDYEKDKISHGICETCSSKMIKVEDL
jgi:hypothetical protein